MFFHVELIKPVSATWKLFLQFLNHVLNWMFQCQDVISSKIGIFCVGRGEIIKSNQNPQSTTFLKKDYIVDLPISHKAVTQVNLLLGFLLMWK